MDATPTQVTYRRFDDIDGQRQDIYDLAKQAVGEMRPLGNASHQLEIADVDYDDDYQPTLADEKDAILKRKSLQRALRGTVRLKDASGSVIEEKRMTLAQIPHLNSRGLFIKDGNVYALRNQLRLRPGAYTRKQKNGGLETHFNVKPGTGRGFRVELDPESGIFKMRVEQSTTRLYPVLRALGVSDDDMRANWGNDLFEKNFRQKSGKDDVDLAKLAKKLGRSDLDIPADKLAETLGGIISRAEIDEDTSELTLGERIKKLSPLAIVKATAKQLALAQGKAQDDNRDSQAFQSFHGPQDLIAERIRRDSAASLRNAFWKASKAGSLSAIVPGVLNKNIDSLFLGSGLSQTVEDINPVETYDTRQAITRLGEGGISSSDAISREARNIQSSYIGVIDPSRAPESSNIGVDLRVTDSAMRGSDGQLYTTVRNVKTGQLETVSARTLSTKAVTFPGEMGAETKRITAIKNDKLTYVPKDEIDYEIVHSDDLMSRATRLIPFPEGIKGQRLLMGSRMTAQAVPLTEPEPPNVQTADVDGTSLHSKMGRHSGARYADAAGIVTKVTPDYITIFSDGKTKRVDLYNNYPMARKTALHNTPVVTVGQPVQAGDILAKSNYTDKAGVFSIGRNLRTAYMAAEGDTIEDAFVISESAARKLGAEAMYKSTLDTSDVKTTKRDAYASIYAGKFSPAQLDKIDEDGAIRVGSTVQTGDPLLLAVGNKPVMAIGAIMPSEKSAVSDKSQVWEHSAPGVVTDVVRTKEGVRVLVKSYDTVSAGDKLSGTFGNKGVSASIRPDDQMPVAEDGKPIEVIMNTNGVISRVNPSVLATSLLGKIVERTGRSPYIIKGFSTPEGIADFALNEAEKHGVPELETVTDPRDGRKISGVFVGNSYIMRLHHKAEGKISARDQAGYTVDGYPARGGATGSKRISLTDAGVLIAAGATNFLRDAKLIRGQKNDDYWRQVRHGETPMAPSGLFADEQFKSMLNAAGVNIKEDGSREQLRPLLDADVDRMAGHEVEHAGTFDFETMEPVKGGLFDIGITGGAGGNKFAKILLPVKIPQPLFLDPIRRILGKTSKELEAILAGKEQLNGMSGPDAVYKALSEVNVDREIEAAKAAIRTGKESQRDLAVKRLHYLAGLKKMEVAPQDLMVSKIAVIPPRYRPIVRGRNTDMIHDYNYLYKDLLEAKKNYIEAQREFGDAGDEYITLMKAVSAVSGTESPVNPKTAEQGVKGVLQYAIGMGSSPKFSMYQRQVIGTAVDTVGRSVITADRHIGLDEVGVPEEMAWSVFRPYIIRRLVQNGMPPAEAVTAVEQRTAAASALLDEEMKERPVVYNRAPALHRYAYQGAWGKRVADDAIHMPYATLKAIGGDFDGNCCAGWSVLYLAIRSDLYDTADEMAALRAADTTKVLYRSGSKVFLEAEIQHFPHIKDGGKVDKNGAITFPVPDGIEVLSYGHVTGEAAYFRVTEFTVDPDKESVEVSTRRGKSVVVSDNESLVAYDHTSGQLEKIAPANSVGRLVPVVRSLSYGKEPCLPDFGWLRETFSGDDVVPVPAEVANLLAAMDGPWTSAPKVRNAWKARMCRSPHCRVTRTIAIRDAAPLRGSTDPIVCGWLRLLDNTSVTWDVVKSVTPAGRITTYDLGVPDTKVFAVNGGLVIQDTINIHVPSSHEAIEDVKEKLMPSKNLFFAGNFETHYEPAQDYTAGLYLASKMDTKQKPVTFATVDEAKAAYAKGLINARTPIRVMS